MNLADRIKADSILHAVPARDVAKSRILGGYDVPSVAGRTAVLVYGDAPVILKKGQAISKGHLNSCVAYVRTGAVEAPVSLTERDAIRTSESYPCVGRIGFRAVVPNTEDELKAFVLAHVSGSGEQTYGVGDLAAKVRSALIIRLRPEAKRLSLEQIETASERICSSLRADRGVLSALKAERVAPESVWSMDLRPGAYSEKDEKAFEDLRKEAEQLLKDRRNPGSQLIHQAMDLHNPSPAFRVNLWLSKLRERPRTRGAIGVYSDATHKDAGVYRRREKISLDVLCSRDAYLYLLDIDNEGELSLLFPNEVQRENRIAGGRTFRLPDAIPKLFGGGDQAWAILPEAPLGIERLKAFATARPVEILPELLGRSPLLYCRPAEEALPDVVEMVERVGNLAPSEWADCACQFHIE